MASSVSASYIEASGVSHISSPSVSGDGFSLYRGDCFDLFSNVADGSCDMVLCDPPYGVLEGSTRGEKVAKFEAAKAAKAGRRAKPSCLDLSCPTYADSFSWDRALPFDAVFRELSRVLRPGGRAVLFGLDPFSSQLVCAGLANPDFEFSQHLFWLKERFSSPLSAKVACLNITEDMLVFKKKLDTAGVDPLRRYFQRIYAYIGRPTMGSVAARCGCSKLWSQKLFSTEAKAFNCPSEKSYSRLVAEYGLEDMPGYRPYKELDAEADCCRAVFRLPVGKNHRSNVFQFKRPNTGFHPTQKPVALLGELLDTYSHPGDLVLDFTMGSGSTGVACAMRGRRFVGFERDDHYYDVAVSRVSQAYGDPDRPVIPVSRLERWTAFEAEQDALYMKACEEHGAKVAAKRNAASA